MSEFGREWDERMKLASIDDANSKLATLNAITLLIKKNEITTFEDVVELINSYKEVVECSLKANHE